MAALVDVSTILAYWVGWLPITMLKDSSNFIEQEGTKYNPYMLKNVVSIETDNIDQTYVYMTNIWWVWENEKEWNFYISECRTFTYSSSGHSEDLILAPKIIYYQTSTGIFIPTDAKKCHYYGQVYYFNDLSDEIKKGGEGYPGYWSDNKFNSCNTGCVAKQGEYESILSAVWNYYIWTWKEDEVKGMVVQGKILEIWDAHMTWGIFWSVFSGISVYSPEQHRGLDVNNEWTWTWGKTAKLQDVLGGDSYVWVFTALYSSLMERWRNVVTASSDSWIFVGMVNTVLSVWFLFAIWIPLIVVAIVFLMRIWILWVAISLSPVIVLLTAFDLFKSKRIEKSDFLKYFKVDNLIPIILSPAVICFAVSLSTVFVTIIKDMNIDIRKFLKSSF